MAYNRSIRDKYESELKEVQKSERETNERYNTIKAKYNELEGEHERIKVVLRQKEKELEDEIFNCSTDSNNNIIVNAVQCSAPTPASTKSLSKNSSSNSTDLPVTIETQIKHHSKKQSLAVKNVKQNHVNTNDLSNDQMHDHDSENWKIKSAYLKVNITFFSF